MQNTKHLLVHKLYFILAVIWSFVILQLCLSESSELPKIQILYKDKIVHFIFYLVFVFLWFKTNLFNTKLKLFLLFFLAVSFGIAIEYGQKYLTTTRSFDWFDMLANSFGAAFSTFYFMRKIE